MTRWLAAPCGIILVLLAQTALADRDSAWLPSYADAQARSAERNAESLAGTLRALPGVRAARVHIALPDASRVPLDRPLPDARVSAWLAVRGPGPSDASVRAVLSAAVAGVSPAAIQITRQPDTQAAPPTIPLAAVGPFLVSPGSAPWLRGVLTLLLLINAALCTFIVTRHHPTPR